MGNQLSSIAPSQILSVDHYFTDLSDYEYDIREGLCVVKVFAIQDPSLPLRTYNDHIKEITDKLQCAPNVLPFEKVIITDKAGILVRQYMKDNLYDRISTRPFLNLVEKKWIVFQLLCALGQCHQHQVHHGDIKTENVMVTSWTSVLLTDFASFKPTFLQEDNPADFSYFFDTSRRRTCYLAPERFQDTRQSELSSTVSVSGSGASGSTEQQSGTSGEGPGLLDLGLMHDHVSELTSAMDIFSAGCVIAELFSEGSSLFDLSKLLAYRSGDYNPTPTLEKIEDIKIRELISGMIAKDPAQRKEAAEYLEEYRGCLFPEQFYTFLQKYMVRFISLPVMTADERIARISDDISKILKELGHTEKKSERASSERDAGLVIIISLVTSCVRNCTYCDSKLKCLDLLLKMGQHSSDDIILERIVPYILYLIGDIVPRVRARALWTLTQSLQLVESLPKNEGNIFPEYILPALADFPDDREVIVRIAYAENIAAIAETALRFLEMAQLQYNNMDTEDGGLDQSLRYQGSYDVELQELHEVIQRKVVNLLSDSQNIVKQTLLEKGITRLCVFFGRQKANDVVLSHMITFLNDKQDWHLRGAFFDSIVGVASYVGWQSLAMLKPLLQQGLTDTEEFVVCKALNALTCLTELGLLQKSTLNDFTADIVVFLCHPNVWIRYGAVGFVSAVARSLSAVDIHCKLLPLLSPFVKERIVQVEQEVLLISVLKEPVLRSIYDYVVRSHIIKQFFDSLHDRQLIQNLNNQGQKAEFPKLENDGLCHMFRKLILQGMNEEQEEMLLYLKSVILKLHHAKTIASEKIEESDELNGPGAVDLNRFGTTIIRRHADLVTRTDHKSEAGTMLSKNTKKTKREYQSPLNAEWNQMFGNSNGNSTTKSQTLQQSENPIPIYKHPLTRSLSLPQTAKIKQRSDTSRPTEPPQPSNASRPQQRTPPVHSKRKPLEATLSVNIEPRVAIYRQNLRELVKHKREQYAEEEKTRELIGAVIDANKKGQIRRPKGTLLIHLHEHRSAVNKIHVCPNTSLFATASNDGTVKLWDAQRLEKQGMIVKSCFTFQLQRGETAARGKVKGLVFLQGEQSFACATEKGDIYVISPDAVSTPSPAPCPQYKCTVKLNASLDTNTDGELVDMHQFDTASHSVLAYATVRGLICGWDIRSPRTIWKLQNDPALGLITSFVVDPSQCWLTVGSCNGEIVCWDMRFQLPVAQLTHPRGARVRRLSAAPLFQCKPSWVTCAVEGNNEVSVWNLETGACEKSLWASHAPPLSQTQVSPHAVYGVYTNPADAGQFILTAGSDRRIRLWDLQVPENSYIVAGSSSDNLNDVVLKYKSRLIDGTEVLQEIYCKSNQGVVQDDLPKRGPDKPPTGHHDCITDLAVVTSPQNFLISAARDGAIKIWK